MIIQELRQPIPVHTSLGEGYAFLVSDYGWIENMVWTVVLDKTGEIRHFNSTQIKMYRNDTWGIKSNEL